MTLGSDNIQFVTKRKKEKGEMGKGRIKKLEAFSLIYLNQIFEDSIDKLKPTDDLERKQYTMFLVIESCRFYLRFKNLIYPLPSNFLFVFTRTTAVQKRSISSSLKQSDDLSKMQTWP